MVADNFQDGIPPASNFHTSTSEQEAVSVWIVRLLEGNVRDHGAVQPSVINVFKTYIEDNDTDDIVQWIQNPRSSPSYGTQIAE